VFDKLQEVLIKFINSGIALPREARISSPSGRVREGLATPFMFVFEGGVNVDFKRSMPYRNRV
jgi:hypothetical protein